MWKSGSNIEIIWEKWNSTIDSQISDIIQSSHAKIGDIVYIEDLSSSETNPFKILQRGFLDKMYWILGIKLGSTDVYSNITETVNEFRKNIATWKADDYNISKSA